MAARNQGQTDLGQAYTMAEETYKLTLECEEETTDVLHQRAHALLAMAWSIRMGRDSELLLSLATEALEIFERIEEQGGRLEALRFVGLAYDYKGEYHAALKARLSRLAIAEQLGDRETIASVQSGIGMCYWWLGDSTRTLEYLHKSLAIAEKMQSHKVVASVLMKLGNVCGSMGELSDALKHYMQVLDTLAEHAPDSTTAMMQVKMNLASTLHCMGDSDNAMTYYLESLAFQEAEGGYSQDMVTLLGNIAVVYQERNEYQVALQYGMRALEVADAIKSYSRRPYCLLCLADIVLLTNDTHKALEYGQESLDTATHNDDKWAQGAALCIIGKAYTQCGKYQQGLDCLQQALVLHRELEHKEGEVQTVLFIGRLLAQTQQSSEALQYLHEAYQLSHKHNQKFLLIEASRELAALYESIGHTEKALFYYKQLYDTDKAVFNERSENKIQTLKVLHEVEKTKKEAEIHRLRNAQLQREVETMQNDLAMRTLSLSQRTELLRKMKRNLTRIEENITSNIQEEIEKIREGVDTVLQDSKAIRALRKVEQLPQLQGVQQVLHRVVEQRLPSVYGAIQAMIEELRGAVSEETLWEAFEQQFQKIHTGFMDVLAKSYPQLSITERKVCSLVKINMSSKEISHILNISSRSVDTYRYHIRQKLQIPSHSNLAEFMAELS